MSTSGTVMRQAAAIPGGSSSGVQGVNPGSGGMDCRLASRPERSAAPLPGVSARAVNCSMPARSHRPVGLSAGEKLGPIIAEAVVEVVSGGSRRVRTWTPRPRSACSTPTLSPMTPAPRTMASTPDRCAVMPPPSYPGHAASWKKSSPSHSGRGFWTRVIARPVPGRRTADQPLQPPSADRAFGAARRRGSRRIERILWPSLRDSRLRHRGV
jgi:hypothetical protein